MDIPRVSIPHNLPTGCATYRIRVACVLGQEWSERVAGMRITVHRTEHGLGTTELFGPLADEAALMGVLETLYDCGARLLSVEQVDDDESSVPTSKDSQ